MEDCNKHLYYCNFFQNFASNRCMTNQKDLIDKITHGDEDAFAQLMELYAQGVYTLIVRVTRCEEDAEELTQDVFIKVYNHIGKFAGKSSFSTWLYRIAYNIAISYTRSHKQATCQIDERRLNSVELSDVERMEATTDDATINALTTAIEKLESQERALVTLFYYEERSIAECAAIMGQSENNIKVRLHRIRKKLYLLITDKEYEQ